MEERFTAKGIEITYRRAGSGPPLVLAHGAASDGREWTPQLDGLADELTVIAWDEPGSGRSTDPPPGFGLADRAACLAALVDEVGLGPAHVGGLSWGGMVALEVSRVAPDRLASLVLADTYAGWAGSLPDDERRRRVEGMRSELAKPDPDPRAALAGLYANGPAPEYAALVEQIADDVRPESLSRLLAMVDTDLRDRLPEVTVPTLLVWGELDARSPLSVARQLEAALPDGTLVVIPEAGHASNLERPDAFNQVVREWCRSFASGGPPAG